jgi:hypothetical protein
MYAGKWGLGDLVGGNAWWLDTDDGTSLKMNRWNL